MIAPVLLASPDSFVSLVLDSPCSPDVSLSLVGSPTCSLDILPSLANDIASPSCSVDISTADPDNSYCLLENSVVPTGKLGPYVKNGFHDLCELAISLSKLFLVREAHSKTYDTYGLKGSNEEIVFYEECIEPIPSLVESTPSLAEGLPSLVLGTSSPSSTLELPMDKGELTSSLSGHGPPV